LWPELIGNWSCRNDFTIWANAAHGLVMLIATPLQKGLVMTLIEGVPLFAIAAVLAWLRPKRTAIRPAICPKTA
jgi:hypothetical protein